MTGRGHAGTLEDWNFGNAPYVAAPTFLFLYGILRYFDGTDGNYGPGFAWTLGHVMFLAAMLSFGLVIFQLWRTMQRSGPIAVLSLISGLMGICLFIRVIVIDIVTGLRAENHAAMKVISVQLNAYPSVLLRPFFETGPILFQFGLLVLLLHHVLSKPPQLPWWSPALAFAGFLAIGFNLMLLPVGALFIGIGLIPMITRRQRALL